MFIIKNKMPIWYVGSICFITIFTSYSFQTGILIPDVFTAVSILCLVILLFDTNLLKIERIGIYLLFVFSVLSHFSNVIILMSLIPVIYLINYRNKRKNNYFIKLSRMYSLIIIFIISIFIYQTTNYFDGKGFVISNSSHVFIMNHLEEIGLVNVFLKENCDEANTYRYCVYIDDTTFDFVWDKERPLYKTGGWQKNKEEYNEIIFKIISNPKYWETIFVSSVNHTLEQFFTFETEIFPSENIVDGPVYGQVNWHFKKELGSYLNSRQNTGNHNLQLLNKFHFIIIIISMILLLLYLIGFGKLKLLNKKLSFVILIFVIHNILNSIICSNLAPVVNRFQSRLVWLFPLLIVLIIHTYLNRNHEQNNI